MSEKIKITSDSVCDLSEELKERYHITTLPLGIVLGDKLYHDGVDINPDDIYDHHRKTGVLPKTNSVNTGEYIDFFTEATADGSSLIHFTISSEMSSSYNNACIAAQEFDNVYVVDSQNLSTGIGILILTACDMIKQGLSAKDIVEKLRQLIPCSEVSFVIDSLEYLYKGGRCSALSMMGANLLKLKPCIEVKNGKMGVGKKYRGKYADVLKQFVDERLVNTDDIILDRVFVTHAGCDEALVKEIAEQVKNALPFKEVFITRAGCTVSSHCGANTLGVIFLRKSPIQ